MGGPYPPAFWKNAKLKLKTRLQQPYELATKTLFGAWT